MIHETEFDPAQTGSSGADGPGRHITSATPQQCWVALDAAREQAFTGESLVHAEPEVGVDFDNGVAYYAERTEDSTLGGRLPWLPGNAVATSMTEPALAEWWLRPVRIAMRVGEHSAVVWNRL